MTSKLPLMTSNDLNFENDHNFENIDKTRKESSS